ncbi:MAG TPA: 1-(5-phosphoribosyl)-5-[(5-phosphoribosylamino)methylideneamino] imidazole-4-carboxamide isomerase [Candidatus Binatia bacterium]|nr:1-(5-phosphoribosyl)-5-[(5-phosphoribosylamino)methylideneamino] imidazole-4-carboxamide isomerase [Candidatus Binatia bacterium]
MLVIPAIDVRGGRCVRLLQGDYGREREYPDEPAEAARSLVETGARRLHVVDLDAARGRAEPESRRAVDRILAVAGDAGVEVQVGGGVRTLADAERWLAGGASLVILGSVAVRDPEVAAAICGALPGRCLVSLDVRDRVAQAEGWTAAAGSAEAHLRRWGGWPLAGLVRTEVSRDGMLGGPDLDGIAETVRAFPGPVIAAGGVTTVDDVARLEVVGAAGAIIGRAVHEGAFDLRAALSRFASPDRRARRGSPPSSARLRAGLAPRVRQERR